MAVKTASKPRLTLVEQEAILEETLRLIKEPASWTIGEWKCDLYETDKKGDFIQDGAGGYKRACDRNNRPLSQYCVEGALNQATYNKLGESRARKLGAIDDDYDLGDNAAFSSEGVALDPAELLGINELAMKMYEERLLDHYGSTHLEHNPKYAMLLNDSYWSSDPAGHAAIMGLLKTRLAEVKEVLDAREGR
jgi:hypothetical protein